MCLWDSGVGVRKAELISEHKTGWSWRVEMVWGCVVLARLGCVSTFPQPVLFRQLATLLARILDSVWPFYLSAITLHHFLHTTKFGQVPVAHCRFISKVVLQCSKGPPPRQQIHSYRIYQRAPISVLSQHREEYFISHQPTNSAQNDLFLELDGLFMHMTQHNIQRVRLTRPLQSISITWGIAMNFSTSSLEEPLYQYYSAN